MIVNIRGTSGSGKTTLMRQFMDHVGDWDQLMSENMRKVEGYRSLPDGAFYVLGSYANVCGGCDGIPTQDAVCNRVREYAKHGSVLFEGLLISHLYTRYLNLAREYPQGFAFAFLDTPLDVCLERVQARRDARADKLGKPRTPLNPDNTVAKWHETHRVANRFVEDGLPVLWLPWEDALPPLVELLEA